LPLRRRLSNISPRCAPGSSASRIIISTTMVRKACSAPNTPSFNTESFPSAAAVPSTRLLTSTWPRLLSVFASVFGLPLAIFLSLLRALAAAFASLKRLGAHLCIAFLHAGIEHTNRPDPNDVALMDDMVGFGFDIVAASHSHRIAGFRSTINKTARAAFCFYGLGSLSSGIRYSKLEHEGMLVVIGLDRDGDIAQVEMRPIQLSADGWGTVADPATADHINNHFLLLSAEVADGSYKQHFYHDSGKDLVERQYRNLQAAYRTGGIPGVARILSRIRMRHLNRAFYRALGV
jgi:Bacterial capsule synthesis protein PGA_cap